MSIKAIADGANAGKFGLYVGDQLVGVDASTASLNGSGTNSGNTVLTFTSVDGSNTNLGTVTVNNTDSAAVSNFTGITITGTADSVTPATTKDITFTAGDKLASAIKAANVSADSDISVKYSGGKYELYAGGTKLAEAAAIADDKITFKSGDDVIFTANVASGATAAKVQTALTNFDTGIDFKAPVATATAPAGATATNAKATYLSKFGTDDGPDGVYTGANDKVKSTFTVEVDEGAGLTFQIGANQGDELVINVDRMDAEYLGVASADVLSRENATNALSAVDKALNQVASQRAYLGAMQNRLDHKIANLDTSAENLTAAEGQIRDVDMAKQMTEFTNANILSQAATAMLAQANSLPQNVLSLIG